MTSVVWFRNDLRLSDNSALAEAVASGAVVPLYVWSPEDEGDWPLGAASRWWLHHSLLSLDASLKRLGSRLVIRHGPAQKVVPAVVQEVGATSLQFSRRYEPAAREVEASVVAAVGKLGVRATVHGNALLREPWEVATADGRPYQVFTPYWKACLAGPEPPLPAVAPARLRAPNAWPASLTVDDLELLPKVDWAAGLRESWEPGEAGAKKLLDRFAGGPVDSYASDRNRPDIEGTSRLSPHLHFGEISIREVWHACRRSSVFASELGWREFAYHLLWHFPHTPTEPLREQFRDFPWADDAEALQRWRKGLTGYPFVDAGMRELWHTGWMHNRTRMVVASFLVKDLLIPWQQGARWFWDTLVDADLANNTLGWQWTAGCGADAAPYFRIFNPVGQGKKFDPEGRYVRRWVTELAGNSSGDVHEPWNSLEGVASGYPEPIVDHAAARQRALAAFEGLRRS